MNPFQKSRINLQIDVTHWSPQQRERCLALVEQIDAENSGRASGAEALLSTDADIKSTGWTEDAYVEVMTALLSKYYAQAQVISEAIATGTGFVSRDRVYQLAGYPEDRSLKGFTRPVNRLVNALIERGVLPDTVDDLLTPVYDPTVNSYQRTSGFTVPLEVVRMMLAAKAAATEAKGA